MKKLSGTLFIVLAAFSLAGIMIWQIFCRDSISYYVVVVVLIIFSMLPFFISFERRRTTTREITLIATLIALAVASRAAFYLIPQVKPIAAVVIISAACLGAEKGYIIGAFSAFISNFIFGQGYWTPFQMVALALVGFISGLIFSKIKPNRINLSVVGFVLAFALHGLIVDASSVIMMVGEHPSISSVLAIYGAGVPFSLVFGVTTAVFLFVFGEAFIKKIERINTKFGLKQSK